MTKDMEPRQFLVDGAKKLMGSVKDVAITRPLLGVALLSAVVLGVAVKNEHSAEDSYYQDVATGVINPLEFNRGNRRIDPNQARENGRESMIGAGIVAACGFIFSSVLSIEPRPRPGQVPPQA